MFTIFVAVSFPFKSFILSQYSASPSLLFGITGKSISMHTYTNYFIFYYSLLFTYTNSGKNRQCDSVVPFESGNYCMLQSELLVRWRNSCETETDSWSCINPLEELYADYLLRPSVYYFINRNKECSLIYSFHYTSAKGEYDYVDMLEDHFDNCVSSFITIKAEVDNFKLTVGKKMCRTVL